MDVDPFNPHFDPARAYAGDPWPFDTAETGLVDPDPRKLIDFAPVPRLRKRRNGWTETTQRAFILALSEMGCVARAARAVGMTPRGAYRLLDADGADGFAEAWDNALAVGVERLRALAFARALHGALVPVYRRGRLVRTEYRRCDRVAIALLSGRDHSVADRRERATSRRKHRRNLLALRARQAELRRQDEARRAEHQAILDRIEAEREDPIPRSVSAPPRIRRI
jgi:hypothetical protein